MTATDIAALYERLGQISDTVADVAVAVAEIHGACAPCQKRVDQLEILVRGNGPGCGLKEEVASLKQSRALVRWIGTSVVALVSAVLGAFLQRLFTG